MQKIVFAAALGACAATVLFYPPARDKFFGTKLIPCPLPWDTNEHELRLLKSLAEPGDVIVESNLHGWQWMALCLAATGTTWVHAALVDENKHLLTVHKRAIEADWSIYEEWGSTRLALIRPSYESAEHIKAGIEYARSKLGTEYDASFTDHSGNCNGLVASSLVAAGLPVQSQVAFGRQVYAASCFFALPDARVIWTSDIDRRR